MGIDSTFEMRWQLAAIRRRGMGCTGLRKTHFFPNRSVHENKRCVMLSKSSYTMSLFVFIWMRRDDVQSGFYTAKDGYCAWKVGVVRVAGK